MAPPRHARRWPPGVAVRSDFRRQGVPRALVAEVADRARRHGLSAVVTRTVEQTGNVPIFEALGFKVTSCCPDEYSKSVEGGELTDVSLEMQISDENRTS